jgi:hypothetical protein
MRIQHPQRTERRLFMPKIISVISRKERKALRDLKTDLEAKRILPVLRNRRIFRSNNSKFAP